LWSTCGSSVFQIKLGEARRSPFNQEEEEEEEEEEFTWNRTRARRNSERDGTNTLSRNVGFNQSADETRTPRRRRRRKLLISKTKIKR
jgi:hypothetical protein